MAARRHVKRMQKASHPRHPTSLTISCHAVATRGDFLDKSGGASGRRPHPTGAEFAHMSTRASKGDAYERRASC
jgi:hypothetical protein